MPSRAAEKPGFTFSCEVKLSSDFSITVLDAAVIEALVLLTSLGDGQGNTGVVPCAGIGDINIHVLCHSEVLRLKKEGVNVFLPCSFRQQAGLAYRLESPIS